MKRKTFHSVYFHLEVDDPAKEAEFFHDFGFEPIESLFSETECLTDGLLRLSIGPKGFIHTGIVFAGNDLAKMEESITSLGFAFIENSGYRFPMITGPSGTGVTLIEIPSVAVPKLEGQPISLGGTFFEISVQTLDHEATIAFWEKLGFDPIYGEKDGDWVTMADDFFKIGFYRKDTVPHPFRSPAITYFEEDMKDRIKLVKSLEMPVAHELGSCKTGVEDAILETPSGYHIFMFKA
jgi:hypothetical protein